MLDRTSAAATRSLSFSCLLTVRHNRVRPDKLQQRNARPRALASSESCLPGVIETSICTRAQARQQQTTLAAVDQSDRTLKRDGRERISLTRMLRPISVDIEQ